MMNAAIRLLALCLVLGVSTAHSMPSARVGIYAIIDEVTFEPADLEPDRIWISGVFVVPVPISSGHHRPPVRGHLYFSLNPDAPQSTRTDWEALRKVAGTGQVVGFGEYWIPCWKLRPADTRFPDWHNTNCSLEVSVHTERSIAVAEPYPMPSDEGVLSAFDGQDQVCAGSAQIAISLREMHSPGSEQGEPPVCIERIGLISSSNLDSAFLTQTRDPEWADAAEALILRRLTEAPGLKLSDLNVECRDTICRIHLAFPTRQYQEATGNGLVANALHEMPGFAQGGKIIPPRAQPTMDYYLQRRKLPTASAE